MPSSAPLSVPASAERIPLCVDLDGTLVMTDTLFESALKLLRQNPLIAFAMMVWLFSGRAHLKAQIAARVALDPSTLPYNQSLLAWLAQHKGERDLVLVTASHETVATAIANHLGLFGDVIASSASQNLKAEAKRDALVARYGARGYDYIGNSVDDLPVWSASRRAVVVAADAELTQRAAALAEIEAELPRSVHPGTAFWRALRPHQWSKNLLLFVHLLMGHLWTDSGLLMATALGVISFCLCASSVYLLNDLLDLDADRQHQEKRHRPFASGDLPLSWGLLGAPLLLLVAFALASFVSQAFVMVLGLYYLLTLAYSFYLKRVVLLDVLLLAILYTLRIIAGAAVMTMLPSFWLLSFSLFIFTSLAMVKRYAELSRLPPEHDTLVSGRGYRAADLSIIGHLGVAAGYIAVLVLALYINSPAVVEMYQDEEIIWLLCPLLMYWIGRIWVLAARQRLDQDPVIFATRDPVSYLVLAVALIAMAFAL